MIWLKIISNRLNKKWMLLALFIWFIKYINKDNNRILGCHSLFYFYNNTLCVLICHVLTINIIKFIYAKF